MPFIKDNSRYYPYQTWRELCKIAHHLMAAYSFIEYALALLVNAMNLENVLCQVNAHGCNLHIGLLYFVMEILVHHTLALSCRSE